MVNKIKKRRRGFTLIELMVTVLIASIGFVAVGMVLSDSIRGYKRMTTRVHGDIVNDAYVARLMFDKTCRMGRNGTAVIDDTIPSMEILYYSMPNVTGGADDDADMYAEFLFNDADNTLMLEKGLIGVADPSPVVVARNVTEVKFSTIHSKSVQMVLTLDNTATVTGGHSMTITCGAIMHN
jgi:prepilin-type N-terminal cleavage/methylation domain-containing protein